MISWVKRLRKSEKGSTLVIVGASLPLLVGAAGIATDTIQWALWKRQLQRAADSAAIAGVYTRIKNDDEDAVEVAVTDDIEVNHHTGIDLLEDPEIELLADDGDMESQVRVALEIQKPLPFSSMFMASAPVIRAESIAASVPGPDEVCVLATDPSVAVVGLEMAGSSFLDLGECSLMANSKHPTKAASNGASSANGGQGSTVKAKSILAAGGVQYSSSWDVDDYDPNSPPITDPFGPDGDRTLPNPSVSDCTKNVNTDMSKNQAYPMDRTTGPQADVAGQVVCFNQGDGVKVQGALKLQSGVTYIVNGGDLTMTSTSASLTCTGCTIILSNLSNPAATGNINLTGGTLSISAPTADGTYKGIALYQDRRATDDGGTGHNKINGNNGTSVVGVIYIANRSLQYNGGSATVAPCLQIVGKRITFTGNSKMTIGSACAGAGIGSIGGARRVRLVA